MNINVKPSSQRQLGWTELRPWYSSPLGKLFGVAESACLANVIPLLFGYHILVLGTPFDNDVFAGSPIPHRWRLEGTEPGEGANTDLLADPAALPIATECIDVVVLPHTLEFATAPYAVLREVDRVLIPEGHVIVLGFNPFSLWGLWRLLQSKSGKTPWNGRFLSVARMRDWLTLLGFDIVSVTYCFYRPPLRQPALMNKLLFLENLGAKGGYGGGGGYLMLAKKRVSTLTPIKPRWLTRRAPLPTGVVNGASRHRHPRKQELSECE